MSEIVSAVADNAAVTEDKTKTSRYELGHFWKSVDWKAVLNREIVAPRMFMRSGLIRKDLLPNYSGEADHPATTIVKSVDDLKRFFEGKEGSSKRFCIKYSDASNAYGINFVDCGLNAGTREEMLANVEQAIAKVVEEMTLDGSTRVVQEYVEPLTIPDSTGGSATRHKFHLRALLLVVGDMDVYMYDEVRTLISPEPYDGSLTTVRADENGRRRVSGLGSQDARRTECVEEQPTEEELSVRKALHSHVTNQSFNMSHELYSADKHNVALHSCEALACGNGENAVFEGDGCWDQMRKICGRLFKNLAKDKRKFLTIPNTYELFGLDFLVDVDKKVWLLEANPEPSMKMFGKSRANIEGGNPLESVPDGFVRVYSSAADMAMAKLKLMAAQYRRDASESAERPPCSVGVEDN